MSLNTIPRSSWIFPALAVVFVAASAGMRLTFTPSASGMLFAAALLVILFGTVFAAVHHAEVIAHKIGEPYGTLLLTLSVIIIEVAVIATIMLGDKAVPTLARDTVFAVVMIVCNGLVGLCILAGGLRFQEQEFQVSGAKVYLIVLIVLATISLILPNYTLTTPGPLYSALQLAFVGVITLILYGLFLYTQTILHRDYFITSGDDDEDESDASNRVLSISAILLVISLVAVVLLAKSFSVVVDAGAAAIGAPPAFSGIVVALLVLLPESVAAISAARHNKLQKSINLSLGSALATISLTVPAVALVAYLLDKPLVLGLAPREMVLMVMTFAISMLTFATGVTNILFGMVHLLVFAVFLLVVFVP
ncbi:ionic transporter y4hA [Rhodopseudomonas sp. P2A-2r]|uniref:calcium:proton antiporter n=1 Tax=Rhodopseudomonas sp. P2A-2r TaxID=2991972 RepID=UPI002234A9F1|nr:ionic transporter y4hA [Rhodopseudomonas sp. P2A-2r]UZE50414.1 ionic transporter y4hA [Rhodopseudomonas sp. P2A-2r]